MTAGRTITARRVLFIDSDLVRPGDTLTLEAIDAHGRVRVAEFDHWLPGSGFIYPVDLQPRGNGPVRSTLDPWAVAA